jgi:hypothetical protein
MFSSKKAVLDIDDVPVEWVFEYYLNLTEKLTGQTVKMKSVFNPKDSNPSMYLKFLANTGTYAFKCFSTGHGGNHIEFVKLLFQLTYAEAFKKIIADYANYLNDNEPYDSGIPYNISFDLEKKWTISEYKVKPWSKYDVEYWSPYNIGSKLLNHYNVKALGSYVMKRGNEEMHFNERSFTYAYTTKEGEIYKIYQPYKLEKKFLSFKNYLQGYDQLKSKKRLFICSSLKDIMSMRSLNIDGDYIAPRSENTSIQEYLDLINGYQEKYVIFDNDTAGITAMQNYHELYKLPYIHLKMAKDISDSVKIFGANDVKKTLENELEHCKV